MLYEFGITSTFLPNITNPNITHDYISQSSSISFTIPPSPKTLKGLNITFKYTITEEKHQHNQPIFAKITNTTKGLDLIYNPMVFGKPKFNEVAIWLSYWSMANLLDIGDKVNVCFIVENGLEVHECGAKLVYANEDDDMENNMEWEESLLGDLSRFKLSTDTYYLCRRDFFKSMEVDGPTPSWFRDSVGYKIDYTGNFLFFYFVKR